jgi:hypothetical protein
VKRVRSKYEVFIPTVKWLHSQNRTDNEIAECVGIDARRVADLRKKIGLQRNNPSELPITLSEIQKQLLIGGIIGDMCIFKDKAGVYHRMNLAHSMKQKAYLLFKANLLGDLFYQPTERSWMDSRTKNEYHEIRIQSRTHKLFSDLYAKWYRDGKKVIHDDVWQLNELGLAIIYFDDGYRSSSGFSIAMDDYSAGDIRKLAQVLREKFNLACTVPDLNRSVYIKAESGRLFRDMISPFLTSGMEYKL